MIAMCVCVCLYCSALLASLEVWMITYQLVLHYYQRPRAQIILNFTNTSHQSSDRDQIAHLRSQICSGWERWEHRLGCGLWRLTLRRGEERRGV